MGVIRFIIIDPFVPLDIVIATGQGYLVYLSERHGYPRVGAFRDWLLEQRDRD